MTSIAQPLGIDQGLWASAARGMARGQLLYRDVWEQRPPGIYWIYLNAFQWFGWAASTVAWVDVLAATVTCVLIYAIASTVGQRVTAAVAAALYAVLTMPAWLYGHGGFLERAVSETFIVVCVCAMVFCAAQWAAIPPGARPGRERWTALAVGFFAGATLIFKPNAGLYLPAVLVWVGLYSRNVDRTRAIRALALAACAALVVPGAAFLWLWRLDLLHEAKVAVVDFNRYYVGEDFDLLAYADRFGHAVWLRVKTEPLWTIGITGAAVAVWDFVRSRTLPPLAGLTVIWGAAAVLVIVVNGARLYNSYFIQAMPALALLGAWLLCDAAGRSAARRTIASAVVVISAVLLLQRDYAGRVFGQAAEDWRSLSGRTARTTYLEDFGGYSNGRGYSARANHELADYLRERTAPDDQVYLFGINGAEIYFSADRLAAHRFLRVNFFVATDFPDEDFRLPSVVGDLEARRPRYLIFERLHSTSDKEVARVADALPSDPSVARLLEAYALETAIEDFTLYRRRD